ncbi:MAG TPA: ABC transporter substrate-binding protein, partial [Xanthobacteraceae bacterium]|nr:ABC transporter substrate-binding protein [Xanthobacteraceae bacterium]
MSYRGGSISCGVAVIVALSAVTMQASAADLLRLSAAQRGAWESAAPELGQSAGIFTKHGITLDLL